MRTFTGAVNRRVFLMPVGLNRYAFAWILVLFVTPMYRKNATPASENVPEAGKAGTVREQVVRPLSAHVIICLLSATSKSVNMMYDWPIYCMHSALERLTR